MNRTLQQKNEKIIYPKPELYIGFVNENEVPSTGSIECYNALISLIKDELGPEYNPPKDKYDFIPGLGERPLHTDY